MKVPETSQLHVLWRECRMFSSSLIFSLPLIFTLVAASISNFLTSTTKFSCCSSNKIYLRFLFLALFLFELCWPVAYFLFFPVFLFLYIPNCGHDSLSKLNSLDNTDTETISLFVFVLIDSLIVSASQDAGGHTISRQKTSSCISVTITC